MTNNHIGGCVCAVCKSVYPPSSWYAKNALPFAVRRRPESVGEPCPISAFVVGNCPVHGDVIRRLASINQSVEYGRWYVEQDIQRRGPKRNPTLRRARNALPGNRVSMSIRFRIFGVVRYFEVAW